MKSTKRCYSRFVLLASACVALLSSAVHAQTVATQYGDLILGFQVPTNGANPGLTANLEVDLGPITQFHGGTNLTLGVLSVQDLKDVYGANWGSRADLLWGAVGTANGTTGSLGFPANTLWASDPSGQAALVPGTSSAQGIGRANLSTMIASAANGCLNGQMSTSNSAFAAVINNTLPGSWTKQETVTPGLSFNYFNQVVDGSANLGSGQASLDLYELQPGTDGEKLGTLVLTEDGLNFVAVPEPSVMALVAVGLASVAFLQRKKMDRA